MNLREYAEEKMRAGGLFPPGRPFAGFPLLTEMTSGLQGIFLLAGATKIGKTTLTAHLVAGVLGEDYRGVLCETESALLAERVIQLLGAGDPRLDYLEYGHDFDKAVQMLRYLPTGFLVVDTVQGTTDLADHDGHLDAGVLHALERRAKVFVDLVRDGYAVIVVSQINDRNRTAPPPMAAIKGASALEQAAWVVVSYGTAGQDRALVLRRLRRHHAPGWPDGSTLVYQETDQGKLVEVDGRQSQTAPPSRRSAPSGQAGASETVQQRVDRIMAANPGISAAALGRLTGLSKAQANVHQRRRRGVLSTVLSTVLQDGDKTGGQDGSNPC